MVPVPGTDHNSKVLPSAFGDFRAATQTAATVLLGIYPFFTSPWPALNLAASQEMQKNSNKT